MANSAIDELTQKLLGGEIDEEQFRNEVEALQNNLVQPVKSDQSVLSEKLFNPDKYKDVLGNQYSKDTTRTVDQRKVMSTPMPKFAAPEDRRKELYKAYFEQGNQPIPEDARLDQLKNEAMQQDAKGNVIGSAFRGLGTIATSLGAPAVGNDIQQEWSRPNRLSWDTKQRAAELENFIAKKRGLMSEANKYAGAEQDKMNKAALDKYSKDIDAFKAGIGTKTSVSEHSSLEGSKEAVERPPKAAGGGAAKGGLPLGTDIDHVFQYVKPDGKVEALAYVPREGINTSSRPYQKAVAEFDKDIRKANSLLAGMNTVHQSGKALIDKGLTARLSDVEDAAALDNLATGVATMQNNDLGAGVPTGKEYERSMAALGLDSTKPLSKNSIIALAGSIFGDKKRADALKAILDITYANYAQWMKDRLEANPNGLISVPYDKSAHKPANVPGITDTALAAPRMGVAPAATSDRKVGDIKTFPNGRKGRWDGRGWVPL